MFAGFQDEGFGVIGAAAGDLGEFVDREVGKVVAGGTPASINKGMRCGVEAFQVAQILRDAFDVLFLGDFHRQQRILGARTQFVDGVFVEAFDFEQFGLGT